MNTKQFKKDYGEMKYGHSKNATIVKFCLIISKDKFYLVSHVLVIQLGWIYYTRENGVPW